MVYHLGAQYTEKGDMRQHDDPLYAFMASDLC
ncbi:hypothetical protein BH11ARM2_BH11ARM2_11500 [soil metagenome]